MTIGDLAHLGSPRGAQRDPAPPIARGRVVRAPASVTDSMVVALDRYALAFPYEVLSGRWPAGGRLPQSGDVCLVIFDDAGDAWVRGGAWQAETLVGIDGTGKSLALQLLSAQQLVLDDGSAVNGIVWPGGSGFSNALVISHGLGRIPKTIDLTPARSTGGAWWFPVVTARSATSITVVGCDPFGSPAAADTATIDWLVLG